LLIETGQHVSARSRAVALDAACRFLITTGAVKSEGLENFLTQPKAVKQRFLQVTQPVVAESMDVEFAEDFRGLELIDKAGTVIARDGERDVVTPYDNCILVQPSLRHLGPGVTVVRLAKLLDV
jgi:hypothetical protein